MNFGFISNLNYHPLLQVLPEEFKKEKTKWDREYIDRLQKEKESWHTYELPKELAKERKKWLNEVDDKITSEKKNWKNAELPEEIERERRKWMKLLESTLTKEKEKWQTQDLPSALEKERENWKKTLHEEVEKKLMQRLEVEKDKLQKVGSNDTSGGVMADRISHCGWDKTWVTVFRNIPKFRIHRMYSMKVWNLADYNSFYDLWTIDHSNLKL